MPFSIVRNDIACMTVDAIVNTANPRPVIGWGTDSRIHEAAGPALLEARRKIGHLVPGQAAITPGCRLPAKYVIHTVGPVWQGGGCGEEETLRRCYDGPLALALEKGCRSIAFPLISTGNYGFPKDKALQIALSAFQAFLLKEEMEIILVVFDGESFRLSEKLFRRVASYIDEHSVRARLRPRFEAPREMQVRETAMPSPIREMPFCSEARSASMPQMLPCESAPSLPKPTSPKQAPAKPLSLGEKLKQADAGFTETLLKHIDQTGKKDSEIYKKANISKQHFSKIRNDPNYRPKKPTAVAFAMALELNLEETQDLIGRAGFALNNNSTFDLIIRYFIDSGIYNVMEINFTLFEYDQPLLGA